MAKLTHVVQKSSCAALKAAPGDGCKQSEKRTRQAASRARKLQKQTPGGAGGGGAHALDPQCFLA